MDVHLFSVATPCYWSMLREFESFQSFDTIAANGHYLVCKSLTCDTYTLLLNLLYRSTFILLSVKCMLGLFMFP